GCGRSPTSGVVGHRAAGPHLVARRWVRRARAALGHRGRPSATDPRLDRAAPGEQTAILAVAPAPRRGAGRGPGRAAAADQRDERDDGGRWRSPTLRPAGG